MNHHEHSNQNGRPSGHSSSEEAADPTLVPIARETSELTGGGAIAGCLRCCGLGCLASWMCGFDEDLEAANLLDHRDDDEEEGEGQGRRGDGSRRPGARRAGASRPPPRLKGHPAATPTHIAVVASTSNMSNDLGSSFSSDGPASAVTLTRIAARGGRERLVMQQGVLMRVGPDGTTREPTEVETSRLQSRARVTGVPEAGAGCPSAPGVVPPVTCFSALVERVEAVREPIYSVAALALSLEHCTAMLPVRLAVEETAGRLDEYTLTIAGPLIPTQHSSVLGTVEDIILDDCDTGAVQLTAVRLSDVSFTGTRNCVSAADWSSPARRAGSEAPSSENLSATDAAIPAPPLSPAVVEECEARLLAFVKNVMENQLDSVQHMHLTRCQLAPLDLGRALPLPLVGLRGLTLRQCPLTPAHIDALVLLARAENCRTGAEQTAAARPHYRRHGSTLDGDPSTDAPDAAAEATGASPFALGNLAELQLSGNLTDDAVAELLSYFNDDIAVFERPALHTLYLPSLRIRAAREHPFIEAHPYVRVLPSR